MYVFVAVYYAQIKKIESHVIKDHEEYSMIAFHLNAEGKLFKHCKPPEHLLLLGVYRTQVWIIVALALSNASPLQP